MLELKDYTILIETMEEVNQTTRDEYGLKAGGIIVALEKFETFVGFELGYLLFGAAKQLSKTLQGRYTSFQEALSAVNLAKLFYRRQRTDDAFNTYHRVTKTFRSIKIGTPQLP